MSRDINDLTPGTRAKYLAFAGEMKLAEIDYIVTCTYRSQAEQDALYAQGRTAPGKKVTWTRHSRHTQRTAFDIAILVNGKLVWNPTLDADGDGVAEYTEAGLIGEKVGLTWGGRWSNPDAPHFQNDEKEV